MPDERKLLLERYASCNEAVAREYLKREDGRLFYDVETDIPMWTQAEYTQEQESFMRIMAEAISAVEERHSRLMPQDYPRDWLKAMWKDCFGFLLCIYHTIFGNRKSD